MSVEYEQEQVEKLKEQEKMEAETRKLSEIQRRERKKAIEKTVKENERRRRLEEIAIEQKARENTPEGRLEQAKREYQAKYERDRASGMTPMEIKVRDNLRNNPEWFKTKSQEESAQMMSADPKKKHSKWRV